MPYDGLVYLSAVMLVCLYVFLGVMARSTALKIGCPAIVGALTLAYSLSPLHLMG
jgi:hypothetical protein